MLENNLDLGMQNHFVATIVNFVSVNAVHFSLRETNRPPDSGREGYENTA